MVGVDGGSRVDLQTVVVLAGVFKQAVHGVEHLVGQQEEPLPAEREDTSHHEAEEHGILPERLREDHEYASSSRHTVHVETG